mgnify:FL=1
MICTLLSNELPEAQKFDILEKEYNIPIDTKLREDVSVMCNLSLGIEERAEARGEARGMKRTNETIIINMYKNKFTLEQISLATQKSVEEIEHIIEENCVTM